MAWITGNFFLSTEQQQNNALEFRDTMKDLYPKATDEAIAGILGNLQSESSINPGIWEGLAPYAGGYGLCQWTPYTKYSEWAGSGWENNGQKETERIIYEAKQGLQWFANPEASVIGLPYNPPITLLQYLESTENPYTLGLYWLAYYEHPGDINQRNRGTQAESWYEYISGHPYHGKSKLMLLLAHNKKVKENNNNVGQSRHYSG